MKVFSQHSNEEQIFLIYTFDTDEMRADFLDTIGIQRQSVLYNWQIRH